MQYTNHYQSPLGGILLAGDETGLTGLWFDGEKYFADHLDPEHVEKDLPLFRETKRWLDIYFSGSEPGFMPPLHMTGSLFSLRSGKSCVKFLTALPRLTEKSRG